jgi:hypothetical protein
MSAVAAKKPPQQLKGMPAGMSVSGRTPFAEPLLEGDDAVSPPAREAFELTGLSEGSRP